MASLHESIKSHLEGFAGLSALISTRVYPMRLPQSPTYPAVTYMTTSGFSEYRHGGLVGKGESFVQVGAWGEVYLATKAVAEQVRLAMDTFTGTIGSLAIAYADRVGAIDLVDPEEPLLYHISQDFRIRHAEAVA